MPNFIKIGTEKSIFLDPILTLKYTVAQLAPYTVDCDTDDQQTSSRQPILSYFTTSSCQLLYIYCCAVYNCCPVSNCSDAYYQVPVLPTPDRSLSFSPPKRTISITKHIQNITTSFKKFRHQFQSGKTVIESSLPLRKIDPKKILQQIEHSRKCSKDRWSKI